MIHKIFTGLNLIIFILLLACALAGTLGYHGHVALDIDSSIAMMWIGWIGLVMVGLLVYFLDRPGR